MNWLTAEAQFAGWAKSVDHLKRAHAEAVLVTDSLGARILVDKLRIPFTECIVAIDNLPYPPGIWAAGKVAAYGAMKEPYCSVDSDCFLYKPLPQEWLSAPIGAQNIEDKDWFRSAYMGEIAHIEKNFKRNGLPSIFGRANWAPCVGEFVVNNMEFNELYFNAAHKFMTNNRNAWAAIKNQGCYSIIAEQWLAACAAEALNIPITYLSQTCDKEKLANDGICHLWGEKKTPAVCAKVIQVVARDYPDTYERIVKLVK